MDDSGFKPVASSIFLPHYAVDKHQLSHARCEGLRHSIKHDFAGCVDTPGIPNLVGDHGRGTGEDDGVVGGCGRHLFDSLYATIHAANDFLAPCQRLDNRLIALPDRVGQSLELGVGRC